MKPTYLLARNSGKIGRGVVTHREGTPQLVTSEWHPITDQRSSIHNNTKIGVAILLTNMTADSRCDRTFCLNILGRTSDNLVSNTEVRLKIQDQVTSEPRRRMKTVSKKEERRRNSAEFTIHGSFSIPHLRVISHLLRSMTHLWASRYPDAQIKAESRFMGPRLENLIKWSNPRGSRTI